MKKVTIIYSDPETESEDQLEDTETSEEDQSKSSFEQLPKVETVSMFDGWKTLLNQDDDQKDAVISSS